MIICQFCGASNNEVNGRLCRKCGALLPVPSKSPRMRISTKKKEKSEKDSKESEQRKEKKKKDKDLGHIPSQTRFFSGGQKGTQEVVELDLQEIPEVEEQSNQPSEPITVQDVKLEKIEFSAVPSVKSLRYNDDESKLLKEIEPRPYAGSVIADKEVYGPPKSKSKRGSQPKQLPPNDVGLQEVSDIKRKQLETDMTEVLSVLSSKLKLPEEEKPKSKSAKSKEAKPKIPPANMNEILGQLLSVDLHIEASAILKGDQILASAISSRISDRLLATIGQNLTMIGTDIIAGLSAGKLQSISVRGTEGILDLARLDKDTPSIKDMILIIFSHPKIKSGIINFAVNIVKKQIKEYLGIN